MVAIAMADRNRRSMRRGSIGSVCERVVTAAESVFMAFIESARRRRRVRWLRRQQSYRAGFL
jgi:hypothetical protein